MRHGARAAACFGARASTLIAIGAALVGGCAAVVHAPDTAGQRPPRADISTFQLSGRVAVKSADRSFSARLEWAHEGGGRDRLLLSTPLGQGLAELVSDDTGARLETADRQNFTAPDLDGISEEAFGARLPLSRLPRWVVGDATSAADLQLDGRGRPLGFSEDGWIVAYGAYEGEDPSALPVLIRFARDDLEVKLRVDRWSLSP